MYSVTMNSIFINLTGNKDRHKILDGFEFRPDLTSHFGVTCPWVVKENDVSSFSQSTLNRYLSNSKVTRTCIEAQMSSNLVRIGLLPLEFFAFECGFFPIEVLWRNWCLQLFSAGIESRTSSHFGRICPVILQLRALERWKKKMSPAFLTHLWLDLCQRCR